MKLGTARHHQDLLYEIMLNHSRVVSQGTEITFMWVPAHIGIPGNEKADRMAKEAVKRERVDINMKGKKKSQSLEGNHQTVAGILGQLNKDRNLYRIQKKVGLTEHSRSDRKEQVIMSRLQIGHSNLNNTLH